MSKIVRWRIYALTSVILCWAIAAVARSPLQPVMLKLIGADCIRTGKMDFQVKTQLHAAHDAATLAKHSRLLLLVDGGSLTVSADGAPAIEPILSDGSDIPLGDFKGYAKAELASGDLESLLGRPVKVDIDVDNVPQRVVVMLIVDDEGVFWQMLDRCDQAPGVPSNNVVLPAVVRRSEGVSASAAGFFSITATITYTDNLGVSRPLPNVEVELWDYDVFTFNDLLASGSANSQGVVTFSNIVNTGDEAGSQDIFWVIRARRSGVVNVTNDGSSTYTWTTTRIDNFGDGSWTQSIGIAAAQSSGACNIYDSINKAYNYVTQYASPVPSQVTVVWPWQQAPYTYYQSNKIFIEGGTTDAQEWAESVSIHEYGHHLDSFYAGGFVPDYGGATTHIITGHYTAGTAWGEGWGDFFQSPVRQFYGYANSDLFFWGNGASRSLENGAVNSGADTDVELNVAAAMYDIFDSNSDTGDTLTDGFSHIWSVFDAGTGTDTIFTFWDVWTARGYGSLPQVADIFYQQGCYAAVDDVTSPSITITGPSSASTYTTSNSSVTVSGTASDNLRVSSLQWSNDRGGGATVTGATSWSISSIPLQAGLNNITVKALDRKGNSSTDTIAVTYNTADTTTPTISITTPVSSGSYSTSSSGVSLAGSASDNVGVTSVTWSNDRGGSGTASGTSPTWSASNLPLFSGVNTITVSAFDAAGNRGQAQIVVTYTPPCSITVTSPNGGETLNKGQSTSVRWQSSGGCSSTVRIELLRAGALNSTISSSATNNGSFSWTVPTTATTASDYTVRVVNGSGSPSDTSNGSFTITAPQTCTIALTAPVSGQTWRRNSQYGIGWTLFGGGCSSQVRIELWSGGALHSTIAASTANNGSYNWTIGSGIATGGGYFIRIIDSQDPNVTGLSGTFNIGDPLTTAKKRGDFNGDLTSDIFWRNANTGENSIWFITQGLMTGGATAPFVPANAANIIGVGDFNNDGRADLIWRNTTTGVVSIWFMNGGALMGGLTLANLGSSPVFVAGVGDFNHDGYADILWRDPSTGANSIWYVTSAGFVGGAAAPPLNNPNFVPSVADFNNDGYADIFWRNTGTGENYIWLMNGGQIIGGSQLPTVLGTSFIGTGDFNGDGTFDLLWRNFTNGQNFAWFISNGAFSSGATLPTIAGTAVGIAGIGDFDGDGRYDLLWRNPTTGANSVWLLDGTMKGGTTLPTAVGSQLAVVSPK